MSTTFFWEKSLFEDLMLVIWGQSNFQKPLPCFYDCIFKILADYTSTYFIWLIASLFSKNTLSRLNWLYRNEWQFCVCCAGKCITAFRLCLSLPFCRFFPLPKKSIFYIKISDRRVYLHKTISLKYCTKFLRVTARWRKKEPQVYSLTFILRPFPISMNNLSR